MARMRSFTAKANKGKALHVLCNNLSAAGEKRRKQEKKDAEKAANRSKREFKRKMAREEREREDRKKRAEREAERQAKGKAKLNKETKTIADRVLLDLPKAGLHPSRGVAYEIAKKAIRASVSPTKAKSYFIDGKENELAKQCAVDYLNSTLRIEGRFNTSDEFKRLVELVRKSRPQKDASKMPEFAELKKKLQTKVNKQKQNEKRRRERHEFINELLTSKIMFRDEIEEFAEIIEKTDMDIETARSSSEFNERVQNKKNYVDDIKAKIKPFKLD